LSAGYSALKWWRDQTDEKYSLTEEKIAPSLGLAITAGNPSEPALRVYDIPPFRF
jgi:hypothetical protein